MESKKVTGARPFTVGLMAAIYMVQFKWTITWRSAWKPVNIPVACPSWIIDHTSFTALPSAVRSSACAYRLAGYQLNTLRHCTLMWFTAMRKGGWLEATSVRLWAFPSRWSTLRHLFRTAFLVAHMETECQTESFVCDMLILYAEEKSCSQASVGFAVMIMALWYRWFRISEQRRYFHT